MILSLPGLVRIDDATTLYVSFRILLRCIRVVLQLTRTNRTIGFCYCAIITIIVRLGGVSTTIDSSMISVTRRLYVLNEILGTRLISKALRRGLVRGLRILESCKIGLIRNTLRNYIICITIRIRMMIGLLLVIGTSVCVVGDMSVIKNRGTKNSVGERGY